MNITFFKQINKAVLLTAVFLISITVVSGCLNKKENGGGNTLVNQNETSNSIVGTTSNEKNIISTTSTSTVVATTTEVSISTTTASSSILVASGTEEINMGKWNIYRNDEYGYILNYPQEWSVSEVNYYEKDFDMYIKYVSFIDKDKKYFLRFSVNKKNENVNYGRTGIGAGDFKNPRQLAVGDIKIEENDLVYEGKIKEVFFSGGNSFYDASGFIASVEDNYEDNFEFDYSKVKIAEAIIKSLKFIK
jgi:hypothetical protein